MNGGVSLGSPTALRRRCNLIWLRFRSFAARTKTFVIFLVDVLTISVLTTLCGANDCGKSKFVMVWQQQAGTWRITRVVSYDH